MGITFRNLSKALPYVTKIRKPVLLRAKHGVGKSTCVYAYAKHVGLPIIERRASQMTEGDLLGLPKVDGDCTRWISPDWLKACSDAPHVLFIDEIDRATQEVRQGFFELTDSRKIAGLTLHPDTLIFAAVNGGEHGASYQVGEMDPAELDRWTVFDLEPDVEDWLNWGKDNIDPIIWDFINQNHKHLEHTSTFEPNKVYPSRRSWHRLSEALADSNLATPGKYNGTLQIVACGFIGFEGSIALCDFIKQYQQQVFPEDIVDKGRIALTKDFGINEHCALIEKIDANKVFEKKLTKKQCANIAAYFNALPGEAAMKLFGLAGGGHLDNVRVIRPLVLEKLLTILGNVAEEEKEKEA